MNSRRALTLIEVVVYMAVLSLIMSLAYSAYYRADGTSRALSRNAADILRAVQAGEQWRREVREASGVPRLEASDGVEVLHVPQAGGEVRFHFAQGKVYRQDTNHVRPIVFLSGVARSRFFSERRAEVQGWRWELELKSGKTNAALRPLFTFLVPVRNPSPR